MESFVRTSIISLALRIFKLHTLTLHIAERQNLPFAVQRLKGNKMHCTVSDSCPILHMGPTQICCRPSTTDGKCNDDHLHRTTPNSAVDLPQMLAGLMLISW